MAAVPCALLASCCNFSSDQLLRLLYKPADLPEKHHILETVYGYPWTIDNKYYTAEIQLCLTDSKTIGSEAFAESVQAVIIHFDADETSSFERVKSWLPFLQLIEPNIQILSCHRCTQESVVTRQKVIEWCLGHGFELVEMNPEDFSDDEEENDFKETQGIPRIKQALHAHTWPNLVMKENPSFRSPLLERMMLSAHEEKSLESCGDKQTLGGATDHQRVSREKELGEADRGEDVGDYSTHNTTENVGKAVDCVAKCEEDIGAASKDKNDDVNERSRADVIDGLLGSEELSLLAAINEGEDQSVETFETLFSQMRLMKERAEGLPFDERKAYAEKVAISFWKSIGGDEEEISGLTDND